MATYARARRGLPRVAGGDPWPPASAFADVADAPDAEAAVAPASSVSTPAESVVAAVAAEPAATTAAPAESVVEAAAPAASTSVSVAAPVTQVRRGLPRVPGGEPWPPAGTGAPVATTGSSVPVAAAAPVSAASSAAVAPAADEVPAAQAPAPSTVAPSPASGIPAAAAAGGTPLRRGLPRVPGGEPWPPAGSAPQIDTAPTAAPIVAAAPIAASVDDAVVPAAAGAPAAAAVATDSGKPAVDLSVPLPFTRTVWPGRDAFVHPQPVEPRRIGRFTKGQWAGLAIVGGGALLVAAALAVLFVRVFLSFGFMQDFLATYPGEYHLPPSATEGFPVWAQWQHYFNIFLMVLIIRSGLQVRTEQRPDAFWTPRWSRDGKSKISLNLWFHQSLDVLWVLNGIVFIVLLFVSGHWMRIVPTSWDVFPNALSALLQYVSLDWPVDNGWVNYNSLQQLMYFLTVFVAAPLAVISGVRMSGLWPAKAKTLNRIYPVEIARAVHFPVMLYFVIFIVIHVTLVFATGALRNLNHMFGGTDVVNWNGFWIMFAGLVIVVAAWIAARPLVLAPIAKLSGKVSAR